MYKEELRTKQRSVKFHPDHTMFEHFVLWVDEWTERVLTIRNIAVTTCIIIFIILFTIALQY